MSTAMALTEKSSLKEERLPDTCRFCQHRFSTGVDHAECIEVLYIEIYGPDKEES